MAGMDRTQVIGALQASAGKRVQITFQDSVVQLVDVGSVDDEGFLHSRPDGGNPQEFWTRFEDVEHVDAG